MRKITCKLAILLAFTIAAEARSSSLAENNLSPNKAVRSIQNNLLPVHYLQGQVTRKSIPQMMLKENIPGVSMAFIDNGHLIWQQVYGYADLEQTEKVRPETIFAAASLSKPVTAMAALKLVDEDLLNLDEDVNNKLKQWKIPDNVFTKDQKVSLRQLIAHQAGIKNHLWSSYSPAEKIPTLKQMLAGEAPSVDPAVTLNSVPGEKYKYSNPGYSIVEKLIEDVSGKHFNRAIEELVFSPAKMGDSSFTQPIPEQLKERMATGYNKELQAYPYKLFPFKAAGGLWTTPGDLAQFMIALMNDYHVGSNILVSKKLADEIFAKTQTRLGFAKRFSDEGSDVIFEHWGSNAGFTCYMVGSLADKQGLVIMTNSDNGFELMASIARAVAQQYNWKRLKPTVFAPLPMSLENMQGFTGKFGDGKNDSDEMIFSIKDGGLNISSTSDDGEYELVPIANNKFILPAKYITYEFLQDQDGSIKWLRVTLESGYNYDLVKY